MPPDIWDGTAYLEEAKLLKTLRHDNVVKFYDVLYHQGEIGLIIEFAERGSLKDVILSGFLDKKSKTMERISYEIINGIEYLHDNVIIHCDLKSLSILLNKEYVVKICDFGLATVVEASNKKKLD